MASRHVNESLRAVDENTWIVNEKLLLTRQRQPADASNNCAWKDDNGWFYALSEPDEPLTSPTGPEPPVPFPLVYDAGCGLRLESGHAVWKIGNAFLKIIVLDSQLATREHTTLQVLSGENFTFSIPEVLFHGEWAGRYHIVLTEVPGTTLEEVWWDLTEDDKQACVHQVAKICKDLAAWRQMPIICGLDGRQLSEHGLVNNPDDPDFTPDAMLKKCSDLGMTCSNLMFYHCDMSPGNILWDRYTGSVGIIDWERAGFVPEEWIRTKFNVSPGMSFDKLDYNERFDWARRMDKQLRVEGFSEGTKTYIMDKKSASTLT